MARAATEQRLTQQVAESSMGATVQRLTQQAAESSMEPAQQRLGPRCILVVRIPRPRFHQR